MLSWDFNYLIVFAAEIITTTNQHTASHESGNYSLNVLLNVKSICWKNNFLRLKIHLRNNSASHESGYCSLNVFLNVKSICWKNNLLHLKIH